jgi:gamma-glutamyltranspeptidase
MIAGALGTLKQFPATAAIFLDGDGNPPVTREQDRPAWLRQEDLARTLRIIASDGPRVLYEGSLGQTIADDRRQRRPFTRDDFCLYQARITPALSTTYEGLRSTRSAGRAPPWSASTSWPSPTCAILAITHLPCTAWPRRSRLCRSLRLAR